MRPKIRLFVDQPLGAEQSVQLSRDHAHYLFGVMRQSVGVEVALFNGIDGEWRAVVDEAGKRGGSLRCVAQSKTQDVVPDLWLLFAPIKKARTDFIVEKAAEMGVRRILPVQTEFTNAERIRQDRLQAHAVEAAEQCGNTVVAEVAPLRRLDEVLRDWDPSRQIVFCDEAEAGGSSALTGGLATCGAVLIGPEGGFSDGERARLKALDHVTTISLGPRILRADTAAVAALTLWQHGVGDWR
ncbi:16S rRNA (uracil(1498)-N(3))-methyltransferase [Pseudaestuariivita atlantica]|uniref:Ribosomal RNA small subunit methyltransferase E n=1 Tax=Pseudaestuariivita atlantica TaxID=1317121 RepID=A0A0L1JTC4_9RHOB|nr:16S rRNA (uracil(1498)-N(3))-methyltransferase [Pseudaestuariivita atlantica]KNG94673.1 16S rRNA methyltransferase [Pseudaestuariivita atlantica]